MDRKQFEEWFKTTDAYKLLEEMNYFKIDLFIFKEHRSQYQHTTVQIAYMTWQHHQAKVDELKATIKGNHGRIAELERLNRVKAQAIIDLHQEITELKASHHGEVIGHEVHFKKIKQERDELQTLYTQQGINMLKLQKRVDAVKGLAQTLWEKSNEKHEQGKVWESKALGECADEILDVLEQALKREG
ncbi:hypothetical protein QX205_06035 [Acinetobacter pittii]|uniref:hypothetical protein n=1 Tax=Acinetobacter pittii TaxID=48296 RepID=UPI0025B3CA2E|nr:hypothetical protein [Acinetobacter pittii]MDN4019651.1 hypothetical protein [Acinetobacter pittii]